MIGIPLTTLAYILANIGYLAVMTKEEIMLSHAVAVVSALRLASCTNNYNLLSAKLERDNFFDHVIRRERIEHMIPTRMID